MSKGYFWLKFAKAAATMTDTQDAAAKGGGTASARDLANRATVKTGNAPIEHAGVADEKFIEGYTIRPYFKSGEKQAVATVTFITKPGTAMPCALYPDPTAANEETPYCAKTENEAMAERTNQRFGKWAADGVPVLVELELTQIGPDEI